MKKFQCQSFWTLLVFSFFLSFFTTEPHSSLLTWSGMKAWIFVLIAPWGRDFSDSELQLVLSPMAFHIHVHVYVEFAISGFIWISSTHVILWMWLIRFSFRIILNGPRPTCLACHPHEYCIAVGNVKGQISMVWNFLQGDAAVQAVDHWHALPLEDICFSPEGNHVT